MSLLASFTVLGGPSSEQLARKIASRLKSRYIPSELRIFPDGESKVTLKGRPSGKIIVVQSIYPPVDSNLIRALALVSQARRYSSQVYTVIPYLGYARQDREFLPGEIVTISLVAKMFKSVGATRIIIVDIHSLVALNLFQIPTKNVSAIEELVKYFKRLKVKKSTRGLSRYWWNTESKKLCTFAWNRLYRIRETKRQKDRRGGNKTRRLS